MPTPFSEYLMKPINLLFMDDKLVTNADPFDVIYCTRNCLIEYLYTRAVNILKSTYNCKLYKHNHKSSEMTPITLRYNQIYLNPYAHSYELIRRMLKIYDSQFWGKKVILCRFSPESITRPLSSKITATKQIPDIAIARIAADCRYLIKYGNSLVDELLPHFIDKYPKHFAGIDCHDAESRPLMRTRDINYNLFLGKRRRFFANIQQLQLALTENVLELIFNYVIMQIERRSRRIKIRNPKILYCIDRNTKYEILINGMPIGDNLYVSRELDQTKVYISKNECRIELDEKQPKIKFMDIIMACDAEYGAILNINEDYVGYSDNDMNATNEYTISRTFINKEDYRDMISGADVSFKHVIR